MAKPDIVLLSQTFKPLQEHFRHMVTRSLVRCLTPSFAACVLTFTACSKEAAETQPLVSVQAAPVKQGEISQSITTDAVLFPINQATIVPKIASPVHKAYVARGARVHAGQLLLTLENKDLAAAAEQNRGDLEQAQAAEMIATNNSAPDELQKDHCNAQYANAKIDAQHNINDNRKASLDHTTLTLKD